MNDDIPMQLRGRFHHLLPAAIIHPWILFSFPPNEGGAERRRAPRGFMAHSGAPPRCFGLWHRRLSEPQDPVTTRVPGTAPSSASGTSRETPPYPSRDKRSQVKLLRGCARATANFLGESRERYAAMITSALNKASRTGWLAKTEPSSNQERGAGCPHRVCRRGSRTDQRSGSWSGSMVW